MDDCCIYINHRCIVSEVTSLPASSNKSNTPVSVTITYTTVKTYMRSPITRVPPINTSCIFPITWCPQITDHWRTNPFAGNPIIADFIVIGPITRYPQVAIIWTRRLLIYNQRRRSNVRSNANVNAHLRIRFYRTDQNKYRKDQNNFKAFHKITV